MPPAARRLDARAFFGLLLIAGLFGANHVAARVALDHGVDVATAVAVRSLATAAVVALLVLAARTPWQMSPRQQRVMLLLGVLVTVQSVCLYSAVARIPVGLALLAFNSYPLWTALAVWLLYGQRPAPRVLIAMPVILFGLALALDISGAAAGLDLRTQWARTGSGVGLALIAAAVFGVVLALTQHEVAGLDGRLRTVVVMGLVGTLALAGAFAVGGPHLPQSAAGWWGLAGLTLCYGTAFTFMFTLLPKLGVVGSSPILNVEPVVALMLAWALLGQAIAPVQWLGSLLVVGTVMALGLKR